ncbi:MAG: hypothetical protein ACLQJR_31905 [Stellaceae bacterium]
MLPFTVDPSWYETYWYGKRPTRRRRWRRLAAGAARLFRLLRPARRAPGIESPTPRRAVT